MLSVGFFRVSRGALAGVLLPWEICRARNTLPRLPLPALPGAGALLEVEAAGCILQPPLIVSEMRGAGQREWGWSQTRSCFCCAHLQP